MIPEGYFGNPDDFSRGEELIMEKQSKINVDAIATFLT
jgi:hypothetical protein